ncbi:hypothetical protein RhiJN_01612 [Ceratobasidium sp. AG-Ba]|nr:hypothetical protein RhiJN_01612 [Ceratobasidium sp. AG-Ba]QRW02542.1 hypothetical protein RhiLY_01541 [Ceratobasidium sp. AG-Ba]
MPPPPRVSAHIPPELDLSVIPSFCYTPGVGVCLGVVCGLVLFVRSLTDRKFIKHNLEEARLIGSGESPIQPGLGVDGSRSIHESGHSVVLGGRSAPYSVQQASIVSLPPPYQSQPSLDQVLVNSPAPADDSDRSRFTESNSQTVSESGLSIKISETISARDWSHTNAMERPISEALQVNPASALSVGRLIVYRPPTAGSVREDLQAHLPNNNRGTAPEVSARHDASSSNSVLPSRYKPWRASQDQLRSSRPSATSGLDAARTVSAATTRRRESSHLDAIGILLLGNSRNPRFQVRDAPASFQESPTSKTPVQSPKVSTGQRVRNPSFLPFV